MFDVKHNIVEEGGKKYYEIYVGIVLRKSRFER
jgi:hypothetical protein